MQDRPAKIELLQGVQYFLEDEAIEKLEGLAKFRARVALNVVRMVIRELENEQEDLPREFDGLAKLLGRKGERPERLGELENELLAMNEELARTIAEGRADDGELRARMLEHLRDVTYRKLAVVNPRQTEFAKKELGIEPEG